MKKLLFLTLLCFVCSCSEQEHILSDDKNKLFVVQTSDSFKEILDTLIPMTNDELIDWALVNNPNSIILKSSFDFENINPVYAMLNDKRLFVFKNSVILENQGDFLLIDDYSTNKNYNSLSINDLDSYEKIGGFNSKITKSEDNKSISSKPTNVNSTSSNCSPYYTNSLTNNEKHSHIYRDQFTRNTYFNTCSSVSYAGPVSMQYATEMWSEHYFLGGLHYYYLLLVTNLDWWNGSKYSPSNEHRNVTINIVNKSKFKSYYNSVANQIATGGGSQNFVINCVSGVKKTILNEEITTNPNMNFALKVYGTVTHSLSTYIGPGADSSYTKVTEVCW